MLTGLNDNDPQSGGHLTIVNRGTSVLVLNVGISMPTLKVHDLAGHAERRGLWTLEPHIRMDDKKLNAFARVIAALAKLVDAVTGDSGFFL